MINKYTCTGVLEWNNKLKHAFSFELSTCTLMHIFVFCADYVKPHGDTPVFIGTSIILSSYPTGDFICCWMKHHLLSTATPLRYAGAT